MAHENTVSFKVFLKKSGFDEKPEVRRFGIDRDVVSSFPYLKEKLQTIFPALRSRDIIVSWKDNEGDEVVISSDDELIIALTEMPSDVRKLYVTVNESSQKNPPHEGSFSHDGVICDGCEEGFDGFCYKCLQCHDYNLCASCESKGMHEEHFMIRLPVPVVWRPEFGRRLAHHLSKSSRKCQNSSDGGGGGECPWRERRNGHAHKHEHDHVPFCDIVGSYLNALLNPLPAEGEASEPKKKESSASQNCSAAKDSHLNYLMSVGKRVAAMLDPVGIDVEVSASSNKTQTSKTNVKEKSPEKEVSPTKEKSPVVENLAKDDVAPNEAAQTEEVPNVPSDSALSQSEREGWTVLNQEAQRNQNNEPTWQSGVNEPIAPPSAPKVDETAARAMEAANVAASLAASGASAVSLARAVTTGAIPKHNFPMYYPPYAGQQGAGWNPFAVPSNMYPVLPVPMRETQRPATAPQQPVHPNPKIADAVQKMMAMGFSNERGWLTQLLEMKNGDIEKALDVLQPAKK